MKVPSVNKTIKKKTPVFVHIEEDGELKILLSIKELGGELLDRQAKWHKNGSNEKH